MTGGKKKIIIIKIFRRSFPRKGCGPSDLKGGKKAVKERFESKARWVYSQNAPG